MKGFGTVVTGTLISGTIRKEEELEVFPGGKPVRVRGVQVHGQTATQAMAGQRTALNLAGARIEDLSRGMMLVPPHMFRTTSRVDVSLSLLRSAKPLKDRARVHFHSYTRETIAEVVLYGRKQVAPGEAAYAQLRLAEPALLLPGDRFILRQFSPVVTIGGGMVLDAAPLPKLRKGRHESFLKVLESGNADSVLKARIARRAERGFSLSQAVAETGWRWEWVEQYLGESMQQGQVMRTGDLLIQADVIEGTKLFAVQMVSDFHKQNPLMPGISKEALREKLDLSPEILALVLDILTREKRLEVIGELVRLAGRSVVMKDVEAESKKTIEAAFASAGLKVPFLRDVLAGLKVDKTRAQQIVTLLLREKILIRLSDELVFHRSALDELRRQVTAYKAKAPKMDVGKFKDMTGVSRKYAIPLLEYLDRERVTRRVGDERVIL
jgi:selenocysteine-specific elongation factor